MSLKARIKKLEQIAGAKDIEFQIYLIGDTEVKKWVDDGYITLTMAEYEQEKEQEKKDKNVRIINIKPV